MNKRIWLPLVALPLLAASLAVAHTLAPPVRAETGYQNPVTAAPPVSRPNTPSCTVTVVAHTFAFSYGAPYVGSYAPPASCSGAWSKVVLDWNGTVTAGRQFDRIGALWIGGVEILRTSTPEPTHISDTSWHVAKDVTEYTTILSQPQTVVAQVPNVVNGTYTSVIEITATLTFYGTSAQYPAATHPDQVLPISTSATGEGWYYLGNPSAHASATFTLPGNLTRAYLEVYTTGHSCDEFWYGNQPDAYASANGLCGGTAFREIQVLVDGQMAGVAWPFPIIYTGGVNPYLWRPIPGVNAFNIPAYVVDLTPFAGVLADGHSHTISIQVANNSSYWLTDANLLLYQNADGSATSGAVTANSIAAQATETVNQNVNQKSATFDTLASRTYTVTGYVKNASGAVTTTTIQQTMTFTNNQVIDLVNFLENLRGTEDVTTTTTISGPDGTTVTTQTLSYPISMSSAFQIPRQQTGDDFVLPATISQTLNETTTTQVNGVTTWSSSLSDAIHGQALLMRSLTTGQNVAANGETTEQYVYSDSSGACFNHTLAAAQGFVTVDQLKNNC
ncbi:MAG TPA: peptide-N4-asparagine amidase [Ktedonobacterales bacterium]|nr:peptide-N4-asparagine amidase [Ktedonobacterales bacterium]